MNTIKCGVIFVGLFVFLVTVSFADSTLGDILNIGHLPYLKDAKSIQISSYDTSGGNGDCRYIPTGNTLTLAEMKGPGVITHIWVTFSAAGEFPLRNLIFKMYWDDEPEPSVLTPIGDFFGVGFGEYQQFTSLLVGMTSGGYYSYIPMPFRKSARIQVTNLTGKPVGAFYYHIDYYQLRHRLDSDIAYLHAQWRRENPTVLNKDYTILEAKGKGLFLGTVLSMQDLKPNNLWFLEGDEHIYVDNEPKPSWTGTGTEDYFISGWYFSKGPFSGLFHGLTIKDTAQSKICAYRFHVLDAIPFKKSIHVAIEHGGTNDETADYSSLAYWYQKEPHQSFTLPNDRNPRPKFKVYQVRNIIEAESILANTAVNGGIIDSQNMGYWSSETGNQWSNGEHAFYRDTKPGDSVTFLLQTKQRAKYNLIVYYTQAADYGIIQPSLDRDTIGQPFDAYHKTVIPSAPVSYGPLELLAGNHELNFEIIGKNPLSTNYFAGFDGFVLEKITP
ncbi:MAG: glycoside hydrolase family 172 protein [bacterium]